MSYPTDITCTLTEVNGGSCVSPQPSHLLQFVLGSDPPKYQAATGQGDFTSATLWKSTDANNNTTWRLKVTYQDRGHACDGQHDLIRATAADDPTGDFYGDDSGTPDSSLAKATCSDTS